MKSFPVKQKLPLTGKFPYYYDAETDCEILGLPYKQNATTMYVIMPKDSSSDKLRSLQKVLTAEKIESMISKMVVRTAVILFPKLHLACGHSLKSLLQEMGLHTLFDAGKSDLSVMSEGFNKRNDMQEDQKDRLVFGRTGIDEQQARSNRRVLRDVTYKTESEFSKNVNPLTFKDFMLNKRLVKKVQGKKLRRSKRQFEQLGAQRLDLLRHRNLKNPHIFASEVLHKVDLTVNEKGTEGGAATAITLNRSGTNVVFRVDTPFMFLIRHDPTHVPLFYGLVFEPEN